MTHFRFRYKCMGYLRWRFRVGRRRAVLLAPAETAAARKASTAAWRHRWPAPTPPKPVVTALRVGDYIVGEDGDPQLQGHPDIRY
ncbi:hypothetical protein [Hymenobacter ruricola]|uniref:Uncharacterized protein n=1 Tax=Hymenobacter ruricola TaxID=2791023 RepID=A0ABS0I9V4_9BACT|nr:hypothetical protein [Hymenobacter ruricola]MBF9223749.1 hypothetical protein [Hymenobacter ruricola]